jgi:hypothetical protein
MRESIGGTWLFGIVIVFIILFASFLTYSISYTKAFNTKNKIIEIIEQNEGFNTSNGANGDNTEDKIMNYIEAVGYNYSANPRCESNEEPMQGYCLRKICPNTNDNQTNVHYKITTFIRLEIPLIGLTIDIPISGETRMITSDTWGLSCSSDNI